MLDREPTTGELLLIVREIRDDVAAVKVQTTLTNGRVTELEVAARVREALEAERAATLARAEVVRAQALAEETTAKAQALATQARQSSARQWAINTAIAAVGVATGVAGVLLTH